jgi:hypothetical protein
MSPHFFAFVHIVVLAVDEYIEENAPMFAPVMVGCYGGVRLMIRKAAELREQEEGGGSVLPSKCRLL